jgi:thiosulfate/3-mercaptopyruvate sulfurtransferase
MHTTIIQADTLKQTLPNADWLILDCRFLLADTSYGEKAYHQGHIPNAFYLHLDHDLSSPITPTTGRHPLPDVAQLTAKLQGLGLNQHTQVVVYDDSNGTMAGRAWWLLRWMGHNAVALLDGGYPAWLQQNGDVQTATPALPQAGDFQARLQTAFTVEADDLLNNPALQVIDARAAERYRGEIEPTDPIAGRIPNAINRPLTGNLHNGLFKSPEQLRHEWQAIIGERDLTTLVHSCGSGVTACHNQLAMEIAGITGSKLYAGSWSEWIRDPNRPITRG